MAKDEGPEAQDLSVVLHRALPEVKHTSEFGIALRHLIDLCRDGSILRRLLDQAAERAIPDYAMPMTSARDAVRQAESVAREERRRLGLGDMPVGNIAGLIGSQGIWTAATDLPDSLSGLFVNHVTVGLAILVNRSHWLVRKRFSYAHEYAHALFDRNQILTASRREDSSELTEKRANAFAAAFLMPRGGVREQLEQMNKGQPGRSTQIIFDVANNDAIREDVRMRPGSQAITYQDVAIVARHFDVSFEAMVWRLKNLSHISVRDADFFLSQKDIG